MSGRCMAGLPPTRELIGLKIPYGAWEPDTLITDTFGNPIFSVLDVQHNAMGSYEAILGDENGHKLCYIKRRLITKYWKDGWDFCTYRPNFPGQPKYKERDMYGKSVYPFSFLLIHPLKCRYEYYIHKMDLEGMDVQLEAMHGWLGSMTVCCTPMVRIGKWQLDFHRPGTGDPEINIDQSKNLLEVERGNDLLAALCISYAFDKALCQPLVTIIGYQEKEHADDDDDSLDSYEPEMPNYPMLMAPPEEEEEEEYEEEEEFQPAGYLGYEDPEAQTEVGEEQSQVTGYIENGETQEGYADDGYGQDGSTYHEEGEHAGYLEDGSAYQEGGEHAGYLEDGTMYSEAETFHDEEQY